MSGYVSAVNWRRGFFGLSILAVIWGVSGIQIVMFYTLYFIRVWIRLMGSTSVRMHIQSQDLEVHITRKWVIGMCFARFEVVEGKIQ